VDAANAVALTAPLLLQDRPSFLPLGNLATTLEETQSGFKEMLTLSRKKEWQFEMCQMSYVLL
jgi:hypothetical protein